MEIRAAESSAILKQEIAHFGSEADVAEVGQVLSIGDGVARVYGLDTVRRQRNPGAVMTTVRLTASGTPFSRCPSSSAASVAVCS